MLLSAEGVGTVEIMRRTGTSKTCVWRWQERFTEAGVEGLLRDKTRPSRVPPLGQEVIDRVVALTAAEPRHEATHWTAAAMARAVGISVSSVQRIWKAHGLAPHRLRRFKLTRDPEVVPTLRVGARREILQPVNQRRVGILEAARPSLSMRTGDKKVNTLRIYLPPDANTLLWVIDHRQRSWDSINVIVAGKQPEWQWLGYGRGDQAL